MNRVIVYGLIAFLAWQAYESRKGDSATAQSDSAAVSNAPSAPATPVAPAPGGY